MQLTYDSDMFVKTFESEFTWLNGFMRNVRRFGNRTAVIDPARNIKWTYTELNTAANKFANAMKADGVKKGDVVFMQLFNSTQFLLGYISPQNSALSVIPQTLIFLRAKRRKSSVTTNLLYICMTQKSLIPL